MILNVTMTHLINKDFIAFFQNHHIQCYYTLRVNLKDRIEGRSDTYKINMGSLYKVSIFKAHMVIYAVEDLNLIDRILKLFNMPYRNITIMHIKAKTYFKSRSYQIPNSRPSKKALFIKLNPSHAHLYENGKCTLSAYNAIHLIKMYQYVYLHTDLAIVLKLLFNHKSSWFVTLLFDLYDVILSKI